MEPPCPNCGGSLGATEHCITCQRYDVLGEPAPANEDLERERRDWEELTLLLDQLGACPDEATLRERLAPIMRRTDAVGSAVRRAWISLIEVVDRTDSLFPELLDRLSVLEYEVQISVLERDAFKRQMSGLVARSDDVISDATEPVPLGPGQCPTSGCPNLEDDNCPTGLCLDCVEKAYAEALQEP